MHLIYEKCSSKCKTYSHHDDMLTTVEAIDWPCALATYRR